MPMTMTKGVVLADDAMQRCHRRLPGRRLRQHTPQLRHRPTAVRRLVRQSERAGISIDLAPLCLVRKLLCTQNGAVELETALRKPGLAKRRRPRVQDPFLGGDTHYALDDLAEVEPTSRSRINVGRPAMWRR